MMERIADPAAQKHEMLVRAQQDKNRVKDETKFPSLGL
jgi:hypothetical protein